MSTDATSIRCAHRQVREGVARCNLVAEIAKTSDDSLIRVSSTTCEVCSTFFPPTHGEPNPVVSSLVEDAAIASGNVRLQNWASRFHRTGLRPETVTDDGIAIRDNAMVTSTNEVQESRSEPCLYLVRRREQSFSDGEHRSGWPYAYDALSQLHGQHGVVLDDFVEQRFGYHMGSPGYREPWVGIFHHPLDELGFAGQRHNLNVMLETAYWRQAEPWLRGIITLSNHLACQLKLRLQPVPVVAVKHPVRIPEQKWTFERFSTNPKKKLIQLGWYQRNTQAIYSVPPLPLRKYRVLPYGSLHEEYDRRVREQFATGVRFGCRVIERAYLLPDEYESALTENVMFSHIVSASANNVVLDCIAANTPLVVNPHPAVVEYLGEGYPLYYTSFEEVPKLCTDEALAAANNYLSNLDKSWAPAAAFRDSVANAMLKFGFSSKGSNHKSDE